MRIIFLNAVVVNFLPLSGSRHVSHLIKYSRKQTTGYAKQSFSLRISPSCSRWYSFRRINGPDDTYPSKESTAPKTLLFARVSPFQDQSFLFRARWLQQPISFISVYIHGVRYAARSSHVSNVATTPISAKTVQKVAEVDCLLSGMCSIQLLLNHGYNSRPNILIKEVFVTK